MKRFLDQGRGQGLVEYAIIIALIAVVVVAVLALMGPYIGNVYSDVISSFP